MIKVAVWGTGMMGQGLLGFILDRPKDVELVGAIVTNPAKEGKTVGELLGRACDVTMTTDFEAVLADEARRRVHLHPEQPARDHRARSSRPCAPARTCSASPRSSAYPWASDPEWADRFDALAKEHGVSILGTGINPGFVLDALIVMWSSICLRVDRIEASRVNDLSPFGPTVMASAGRRHDRRGVRARASPTGPSSGHIGFPESIHLIAQGARLEDRRDRRDARADRDDASSARRRTCTWRRATSAAAGTSAAATAAANSRSSSSTRSRSTREMEGMDTGDYIRIFGDPDVNMANAPEIPGGKGTYASTGNYIPLIVAAPAGMLTVVDMPLPRFWAPTT